MTVEFSNIGVPLPTVYCTLSIYYYSCSCAFTICARLGLGFWQTVKTSTSVGGLILLQSKFRCFICSSSQSLRTNFEELWRKQLPLDCQTRLYTVPIYTATVDQPEFKYRCWVWIFFFIWNAWIIERERRWGGIHSGDAWSRQRVPTYKRGYWMGHWPIRPMKWFVSDFSRLLKHLL